ncbi:uncharacterized protein K489DRAFT_141077 [Dissoconium aciculare CBS 342.82]|uniref:Uncharacterized protein n=1 Tax=Dissoconium aciculare CBS 342.82 TaxID=1314786 RepID=A0A6J3M9R4_9PEZI|nr:uncharacterized protein K489DRAFT_141077 [Dissoconium aciculare CBS 342.82]KAF1824780.1 hypothetical protein K489DRAFT_141077 [Dissoconium aciculare CBS 342.82]
MQLLAYRSILRGDVMSVAADGRAGACKAEAPAHPGLTRAKYSLDSSRSHKTIELGSVDSREAYACR